MVKKSGEGLLKICMDKGASMKSQLEERYLWDVKSRQDTWKDYRNIITIHRDVTMAKAHLGSGKGHQGQQEGILQVHQEQKEYQGRDGATAELDGCPDKGRHMDKYLVLLFVCSTH